MIYAVALLIQRIFTFDKPAKQARNITLIVLLGAVSYTVLHCVLDNLTVHTVVFLAMLITASKKVRALIRVLPEAKQRQRLTSLARKSECKSDKCEGICA